MNNEVLYKLDKLFESKRLSKSTYFELKEEFIRYTTRIEKEKSNLVEAFKVSERGYQQILKDLKEEISLKKQAISRIKEEIKALSESDLAIEFSGDEDDNLEATVAALQAHVKRAKFLEQELKNAKILAENAAEAKSKFLSMMTHEIRTPLNAITGNIHILMQEKSLPEQQEFIDALHVSAENLLRLINDILDFGKMEEGKVSLSLRHLNIRKLLQQVCQMNIVKAKENGNNIVLEVDSNMPEWLEMDDVRINQIFNNFISNANKFTKNGEIKIIAQLEDRSNNRVVLNFGVKDNGIGIDKDKHKLIFERFTQANSEINRTYGGSGLGLTIVEKLVHLMGGSIGLDSIPGKGAYFFFKINSRVVDGVDDLQVQDDAMLDKDLTGLKILLVEDVFFNVAVAKKILNTWNAEVDVANNGEEAVAMVKANRYSIILMDLQMPVMDGITASKIMRSMGIDTPIIALTASSTPETRQKVLEVGMNNFILKPFNPDYLRRMIIRETHSK